MFVSVRAVRKELEIGIFEGESGEYEMPVSVSKNLGNEIARGQKAPREYLEFKCGV